MYDVLLAYVGEDAARADALAEALETLGYSVGDAHASEEDLRACAARVVLWSADAARSRPLIGAAERFIGAGETIVASLVDPGVSASPDLPVFDLSRWNGDPDDPRLDPLLDVIRRMVIVADAALEDGAVEDDAIAADCLPHFPDLAPSVQERVSAGWLASVPASPPHRDPWSTLLAQEAAASLAAAAEAAPKRSIVASLVIGSFLAGALLTGSLERFGEPQEARSYAELPRALAERPPAEPAPVAISETEPAARSPRPRATPQPAPVERAAVEPPPPADAAPVVTLADYVPPPVRSWEPNKLSAAADATTAPQQPATPLDVGLIPIDILDLDAGQYAPPGAPPDTPTGTPLDPGQRD